METSKKINRITELLYNQVKRVAKDYTMDVAVAKQFNIGKSTVARIRKSTSYEQYRAKNSGNHKNRNIASVATRAEVEHTVNKIDEDDVITEVQEVMVGVLGQIEQSFVRALVWMAIGFIVTIMVVILN